MASTNDIIPKATVKNILDTDAAITKLDVTTLKYEKSVEKLINTLSKGKISFSELNKTQQTAKQNTKSLSDEEKKLEAIEKSIVTNTDAIVKAKILAAQKTKEQKERIQELINAENKELGTEQKLLNANTKLRNERKKLNTTTVEGKKRQMEINKEIDANNELIKENSDKSKQARMSVGGYTAGIEAAIPALRGASAATTGLSAKMKMLMANPIILFLAAIVGAFMLLKKAMTRSEKGQDALNKVTRVFGAILDKLSDIVTGIAESLIDAFSNPKQAVIDLWEGIKTNLINRLEAAKKFFTSVGLILEGVFELDKDKIKQGAKEAGGAYVDMLTGVEDTVGKTKKALTDWEQKLIDAGKAGTEFADMEARYNKESRKILVENAKLRMFSAEQFKIAEEFKRSEADKSMAAYNKGFDIEEEILSNELGLLQQKLDMAVKEGSIAKNDIAMNEKIAEAEAALFDKQAQFDEKRRARTRMLNTVRMEAFKQENERIKTSLATEKLVSKSVEDANKLIIASETSTLEERINAAIAITNSKNEFANKDYELAVQALNKEKELKLKSEEDYATEMLALKAKLNADIAATELAYQANVATGYKAEIAKRIAAEETITQAQLIMLKQRYADGELTQQEYADASVMIAHNAAQAALEEELRIIDQQIANAELSEDTKNALLLRSSELKREILESDADFEIKKAEETAAKQKEIRDAAFQLGAEIVNASYQHSSDIREKEIADIEARNKAGKISDEEAAKLKARIQTKQAKAEKNNALFNIAINTAMAIAKASPVVPLMIFAGITGAIQAALVASKPIPKFYKGTKSAPEGTISVAEKGMELARKRTGELLLYTTPTITDDLGGAQIYTNAETNKILNSGFSPRNSHELNQLAIAVIGSGKETVAAVKGIKTFIIDKEGRVKGEKLNNYKRNYI